MRSESAQELFGIIVRLILGFAIVGPVITTFLKEIASIESAPNLVGLWLFTSLLFSLASVASLGEKIKQIL